MDIHEQQQLPLAIELVPQPCWYSNLRAVMSQPDWDTLRRQVYKKYGHRCGICGASGVALHCHERWVYDDNKHEQRLDGFIALCEWCHHVKHIGHASILAQEGKLDFGKLVEHFKRVNNCSEATYQQHSDAAWNQWRQRNRFAWSTQLGDYASLVRSQGVRK